MTNLLAISLKDISLLAFDLQGKPHPPYSDKTKLWLASASFVATDTNTNTATKTSQRLAQKTAVRKLAALLAYKLPYQDHNAKDTHTNVKKNQLIATASQYFSTLKFNALRLDESSYPYRLKPLNYPVSFSHSQQQVACAIGSTALGIGIDLELNTVSAKVSQRYFHRNELDWLQQLQQTDKDGSLCQQARNLLWMLKEATIKALNTGELISGLKVDFSLPAQQLLSQYQQHLRDGQPVSTTTFFCWQQKSHLPPCSALPSYSSPAYLLYIYLPYLCLVTVMRVAN